jgi:alpha-galactosidase
MLEVGNGGMTATEYRTHMSLWALLAAPLLAGNDVRRMSPEALETMIHPEVIAIDQDPLGKQGTRRGGIDPQEIWVKPLEGDRLAVGLFNRGESAAEIQVSLTDLDLEGSVEVRDVWQRKSLGSFAGTFSASVAPHGVTLLVLSRAPQSAAGSVKPT